MRNFSRVGVRIGRRLGNRVGRALGRIQERTQLAYDLYEEENAVLIIFDAPGAKPEHVQVKFHSDRVHVRVDRFREFHEGFEMVFPGRGMTLDGVAELPPGVSVTEADATARLRENGTLLVRLPKANEEIDPGVTSAAG